MRLLVLTTVHDFTSADNASNGYKCQTDLKNNNNLVIENNLDNIFKFNSNVCVAIHVSKQLNGFDIKPRKDILINPIRYNTKHGTSMLPAILSTFAYAKQNADFDYVLITHSGEMFVKPNSIDYMANYDYSTWYPTGTLPSSLNWMPMNHQRNYDLFKGLFDTRLMSNYSACLLEGTFYSKETFDSIYKWFMEHYSDDELAFDFCAEELMIPTLAYHLSDSKKVGQPINGFFLDKGHVAEDTTTNVDKLINNESVWVWGPNQFSIGRIINSENLYTIKRINRIIDDKIRQYISNIVVDT